jgi:hypothetical protein
VRTVGAYSASSSGPADTRVAAVTAVPARPIVDVERADSTCASITAGASSSTLATGACNTVTA